MRAMAYREEETVEEVEAAAALMRSPFLLAVSVLRSRAANQHMSNAAVTAQFGAN